MNKSELEDLKLLICKKMDVTQFLDVLGFEMSDLVDILEDYVNEQAEEFEAVL